MTSPPHSALVVFRLRKGIEHGSNPLMSEPEDRQASNEVSDIWQWMVQSVLGVALVVGTVALFHYYAPQRRPRSKKKNS
jgi:hypothetical protein